MMKNEIDDSRWVVKNHAVVAADVLNVATRQTLLV